MKLCSVLLVSLAIPAIVALAQPGESGKPTAQPKNVAPAVKPSDDPLRDAVFAQERKLWEALAKQDYAAFGGFLSPTFMNVDSDGIGDKTRLLEEVKVGKLGKYTLSDWKIAKLNGGGVIVLYKVDEEWIDPKGASERQKLMCTTTWEQKDGKWVAMLHTETAPAK